MHGDGCGSQQILTSSAHQNVFFGASLRSLSVVLGDHMVIILIWTAKREQAARGRLVVGCKAVQLRPDQTYA